MGFGACTYLKKSNPQIEPRSVKFGGDPDEQGGEEEKEGGRETHGAVSKHKWVLVQDAGDWWKGNAWKGNPANRNGSWLGIGFCEGFAVGDEWVCW